MTSDDDPKQQSLLREEIQYIQPNIPNVSKSLPPNMAAAAKVGLPRLPNFAHTVDGRDEHGMPTSMSFYNTNVDFIILLPCAGSLQHLTIEMCTVSNTECVEPGTFSALKELIIMDCAELPDCIGNFTSLQKLCIYSMFGTGITTLTDSIGNLVNLTELIIGFQHITSLPESIGNLTHLTRLSLSDNRLTSIPDSIGNITNLVQLDIGSNQLTSLPDSIINLTCINLIEFKFYVNPYPITEQRRILRELLRHDTEIARGLLVNVFG